MRLLNDFISDERLAKNLFDKDVKIYEKVNGTLFSIKKQNDELFFYKKNYKKITILDRTLSNIYEKAIEYFSTPSVKKLLYEGVVYCFTYIPDINILDIKYDILPTNNLILEYVLKDGERIKKNKYIKRVANILNVSTNPILYQGILSDVLSISTNDFLNIINNDDDGKTSELMKLLGVTKTNFMNDLKDVKTLIMSFRNNSQYSDNYKIDCKKITKLDDNVDIIIKIINSDIIQYFESRLDDINIYNEEYNFFVMLNELFYDFINLNKTRYNNLKVNYPLLFNNDIFNINKKFIPPMVLDILDDNNTIVYKIFMNMFNKKKRNNKEFINDIVFKKQNDIYDIITQNLK